MPLAHFLNKRQTHRNRRARISSRIFGTPCSLIMCTPPTAICGESCSAAAEEDQRAPRHLRACRKNSPYITPLLPLLQLIHLVFSSLIPFSKPSYFSSSGPPSRGVSDLRYICNTAAISPAYTPLAASSYFTRGACMSVAPLVFSYYSIRALASTAVFSRGVFFSFQAFLPLYTRTIV